MQVILRQAFPLGRFHATPWGASAFDDPYGEWPPSPFRLVRAIVARFHQLARERGEAAEALEDLVRALVTCEVRYHLPPTASRGPAVRQYLPDIDIRWNPAGLKDQAKGAMKVSKRFLAQDNCIAVPPDGAIYWFLDGPNWTDARLALLDACLARITYFGRAEAITDIDRVVERPSGIDVNCELTDRRERGAVPVLCACRDMTAAMASDEAALHGSTVPPGAVWRFAVRPPKPAPRRAAITRRYERTQLIQFALGASVEPPMEAIATITGRFRGRVLREALTALNDGALTRWNDASPGLRARIAGLAGKDAAGLPLEGNAHASYLVWCDGRRLTRLFVYRARPFEPWEQDAMRRAAEAPLEWSQTESEGWTVRMVPLDSAVPPPSGFDGILSRTWSSVTPFVPARYSFDRRGRDKKGEMPQDQIVEELARRGWPPAEVAAIDDAGWVRVHAPKRRVGGATNNARRSFHVRLTFAKPVVGPLLLGHSSFFGLGLFKPCD
ncbi:type I-G CRISPR-associated protein Csb2 [Sorangium sp. So ce861]|uniref:type I-G CRISPR-associated protein Csb2 n=1 Tax=Sorangium sp. So ce861 TaxID=3133323 RepID=UPI003F5FC90D